MPFTTVSLPKTIGGKRRQAAGPKTGTGRKLIVKRGAACREAILRSAAQLFFRQGFHLSTVKEIAQHASVFQGSVHYHFRTKDDILYALLCDAITTAEAVLNLRLTPHAGPAEQLEKALSAHMDFVLASPVSLALVLRELRCLSVRRRRSLERKAKIYNQRFVDTIRAGQSTGQFIAGDPELIMRALLGMCNWVYRWHSKSSRFSADQVRGVFLSFLMRAVLAPEYSAGDAGR